MKDQAVKDLTNEVTNIHAATKQSIKEMQADLNADRLQMDKAAAASMRSLSIDQKLPVKLRSATHANNLMKASQYEQLRVGKAIKGAGPSKKPDPIGGIYSTDKGAPGPCAHSKSLLSWS